MNSSVIRTIVFSGVLAAPLSLLAQEPSTQPDGSWISLGGTVTSVEADRFTMDYGDGTITVEMDDWDRDGDALVLYDGDPVTVYGRVDDDLYEETTIEASSVYVKDLNTFFYASAADEEEMGLWAVNTMAVPGDLTYIGVVESTNPSADSFTMDTGLREVTINTTPLPYDPLDNEGFQEVEINDVVRVESSATELFFDDNELDAESLITLSD